MRLHPALLATPLLLTLPLPAQSPPSLPTLKTSAQTVLVDVVVSDHFHQSVPGLTQADFAIYQDGKPQAITSFEAHTGAPTVLHGGHPLPPGMFSNFPIPMSSDAVDVLLLDSLNTPTQDQAVVRRQMIDYLKQLPPGNRIAVFTLSTHLRLVHAFTTDPEVLLAAINQTGSSTLPSTSTLLITPAEKEFQRKRQDDALTVAQVGTSNGTPEQRLAGLAEVRSLRQFVSDETSFNDDLRARKTLEAMDELSRYLAPMPGRKNLIWFSGSFPLSVDPDFNQADAYRLMRDYSLDVRRTTQRLALARVAVYPIDARRFLRNDMFVASNGGASKFRNSRYRSDDIDLQFNQITREHDTMDQMAHQTGGEAIYNTNDLKGAMAEIVKNGSRYYTLAYTPEPDKKNGRFHKIQVKLARPGYTLAYRNGYLGEDTSSKPAAAPDPTQVDRLKLAFRTAMDLGVPPSSEILFRVQVLPDPHQPSPANPIVGDNPALPRPTTRYVFDYTADLANIQLALTPDGLRRGLLLAMVIAYDDQGRPLNSHINSESLDLTPKVYADALHAGLPFFQELDIPRGPATIRVGIYDLVSHKIGSTEFALPTPLSQPTP